MSVLQLILDLYIYILFSVSDEIDSDDEGNDDKAEDGPSWSEKTMLVDLVGNSDNAETDPLVHLDGVEEKPDEVLDEQMNG